MKKIICIVLTIIVFSLNLSGCGVDEPPNDHSSKNLQQILSQSFSSSPFSSVDEVSDKLTEDEVKAIISKIPSDKYESYPERHIIPLTATLYKSDEEISVSISDPRLIKIINFYNNSVYYQQYSYSQGSLSPKFLEENIENKNLKLVVTYTPYGDSWSTLYDTIIITNQGIVAVSHDIPANDGEYPLTAFLHIPLYHNYSWLDLFEF